MAAKEHKDRKGVFASLAFFCGCCRPSFGPQPVRHHFFGCAGGPNSALLLGELDGQQVELALQIGQQQLRTGPPAKCE